MKGSEIDVRIEIISVLLYNNTIQATRTTDHGELSNKKIFADDDSEPYDQDNWQIIHFYRNCTIFKMCPVVKTKADKWGFVLLDPTGESMWRFWFTTGIVETWIEQFAAKCRKDPSRSWARNTPPINEKRTTTEQRTYDTEHRTQNPINEKPHNNRSAMKDLMLASISATTQWIQ